MNSEINSEQPLPGKPITSWQQTIFNRRILICVFTGFSSGLPLYVLLQMLPAWLRSEHIELRDIALLALAGMPYAWKFVWAPVLDRYVPPLLGRRRGWMLIAQIGLVAAIAILGSFHPAQSLQAIAVLALLTAFLSATQDIALDAYRRELLPDHELGLGNAVHVQAYRLAGLVPGSLALILADHLPWSTVHWIVAAFMLPGLAMTLCVREPIAAEGAPRTLREAVIEPFNEIITRLGVAQTLWVLLFMVLYKLGDSMATALSTPFYIDLGFSLTAIGVIAKNAALWPAIAGGLIGGVLMIRLGINRALWCFGVVQMVTILGYAVLAQSGPVLWMLAAVIAIEYFGVGLGTAALTAFIAQTTSRRYAATQFALFTALAAVPRTFINAATGWMVEQMGWTGFFIFCTVMAVPGMLLLFKVAPWNSLRTSSALL
jgi:PAT family beta-lactamase induction signal transducer AmpG